MSKEIHMTISRKDVKQRKAEEAQAQQSSSQPDEPQQLRRGVRTFTRPGLREGTADASSGIAGFTGPVQIIGGIALAPFTAGLSAGLIASGMLDGEARYYADSERLAEQNRRLLDEAQKNKHEIEVKGANQGSDGDAGSQEVALEPGSVQVAEHDPVERRTKVIVLFDASTHKATHFVTAKK